MKGVVLMYFVWIASWISAGLLAAFIYKKKLHCEYPIFFAFLVAETTTDVVNFGVNFVSPRAYYYCYWVGAAITTCFGFAVLHEVFRHIFRPYESLRSFGTTLFRWSTTVLLLIGIVMAFTSMPSQTRALPSLILIIDRSVRLMQCGLVLFMYLFARQLGLTDRHRIFGITIGFGLTASLHLMAVTLHSVFSGGMALFVLEALHQMAYLASVGIWALYMYRPEPERRRASVLERPESWNYALQAATNGNGGAAFLPNVVDTVEKVLTKRATHITSEFKNR
jgi:hypothetical protein